MSNQSTIASPTEALMRAQISESRARKALAQGQDIDAFELHIKRTKSTFHTNAPSKQPVYEPPFK